MTIAVTEKSAPKKPNPETHQQKDLRRWLRRWLTSTILEKAPNLQIDQDGFVSIPQLIGMVKPIAQKNGYDSDLITVAAMTAAAFSGQMTVVGTKIKAPAAEPPKTEKPVAQAVLIQQEATAAQNNMKAAQARLVAMAKRTQDALHVKTRASGEAAVARATANETAKADMMKDAKSDVTNSRRIADPKDHSKLATILPPLRITQKKP